MQRDWSKLAKIMSFMLGTKDEALTLSADSSQNSCWQIDAALGARLEMEINAGGTFRMGFGDVSSSSTK